jgi:uncharacterized membrane protein YhfC
MSEFYDITFSIYNIISLALAVVLLLLLPVVLYLIWRRGHKGQLKFRYLLAGAIGFVLFARILEQGVHLVCIVSDNPVSRFISGNIVVYVLYGALMAGVFEECGRYIILKHVLKKDRTRENAVLYGIGHGGIEILTVILPAFILELVMAVMFYAGDIDAALSALKITEETASAALPTVVAASQIGIGAVALSIVERILAMFIHIGLTVVVFFGVSEKRKGFLMLAILLHAAVDVFAVLYQCSVISILACELFMILCTAIIVFIAVKLYRKMKTQPGGLIS